MQGNQRKGYSAGDRRAAAERREREEADLNFLQEFCTNRPCLADLASPLSLNGSADTLAAGSNPSTSTAAPASAAAIICENGQLGDGIGAAGSSNGVQQEGVKQPPLSVEAALDELASRCQSMMSFTKEQVVLSLCGVSHNTAD